ncbi:hypothetical protein J2793_003858 [Paraburkholderia caledonica]|uniref:Uncharacterized protein n=1 Tax=Paraburkholderia caledonica TaxID=134536 RepID=A0AB73IES5_9BURK|nr:hypothetical protein [Paraburkholderia caledonica]
MSGNLFSTAEEMVELSGKRKHHSQAKFFVRWASNT